MKTVRIIICAAALFLILTPQIYASADALDETLDSLGADKIEKALPDDAKDILENHEIKADNSLNKGLSDIFGQASARFAGILGETLASCAKILCVALLCGLFSGFNSEIGSKIKIPSVTLAGVTVIAVISVGDISTLAGAARETLAELNVFSKTLLPSLAAASAAAGSPTAAVAGQTAAFICSDLLITVICRVFIPFIYIYLAISTVNCALGNQTLDKFALFIKNSVTGVLKWGLMLYMAYITLTGVLASAGDSMLRRTARFAISGSVPVVGGIVSEAADTVLGGAMLLRNSIGIFGAVAIIASVCLPALRTGVSYLVFKATSAVCAPFTESALASALERIADVFGMLFGMTAACAALLLISIISGLMLSGGM